MRTQKSRHIKNKSRKNIKKMDEKKELRLVCKNKTSSIEAFEKNFEKGLGQNLTKENNIIQRELIQLSILLVLELFFLVIRLPYLMLLHLIELMFVVYSLRSKKQSKEQQEHNYLSLMM